MQVQERVLGCQEQGDGVWIVPLPKLAVQGRQAALEVLGAVGSHPAQPGPEPRGDLAVPGEATKDGERPLQSATRCAEAIAAGLQPWPSSSSRVRW